MTNFIELFLGQIPEAIYFALFMIFTKQLKEKRILFICLEVIEYLLLFYIFKYSIYAHIGFFILTYCILKILYKEKCQIIDVFTLGIASVSLIIISLIFGILFKVNIITTILNRILLFTILFLVRNQLPKIQNVYKKLWNRNDKAKKKIKSTTFRSINLVLFNMMFYIINIGIVLTALLKEMR